VTPHQGPAGAVATLRASMTNCPAHARPGVPGDDAAGQRPAQEARV